MQNFNSALGTKMKDTSDGCPFHFLLECWKQCVRVGVLHSVYVSCQFSDQSQLQSCPALRPEKRIWTWRGRSLSHSIWNGKLTQGTMLWATFRALRVRIGDPQTGNSQTRSYSEASKTLWRPQILPTSIAQ